MNGTSSSNNSVLSNQVHQIFRKIGIGVCIEWVAQSLEYLSRNGPVSKNADLVANQVYQLFLDGDLHEIASTEGVLPPNVEGIEKGMLSSSSTDSILVLQVDEIVNIGSSANRNTADDDDEVVIKAPAAGSSRMLKLYLTDGIQKIVGLEVKPMTSLSIELPPGTKVKLHATKT
eukprot:CAMPEP_0119048500 /NCGR_PEP_ID=MMETSP1177-20130426/59253_1 /TAXON_ID=2985 /ORGANISM="Ochromonas sp, Strain CCMP1899" /LENGTH=173 /DNA_ID=CAMNT_0007024477 /DNA_START=45 /DNA_END=562 /DNA_ORIENTATION=+